MKARRNKYYKIPIPPYGAELILVLSDFPDKVNNKLCGKKHTSIEGTENTFFVYDKPDSKRYHLIFSHTPNMDCIAHECFHLVCKVLATSDSKFNHSTEEQYAYLLGYIVGSVTDKISNTHTKRDYEK